MSEFKGKAYLITGGCSGIGFATALHLLESGASVSVTDVNPASIEHAASAFDRFAGRGAVIAADAADGAAMRGAIDETVARFSRLDGLVANAGIRTKSVGIVDLTEETWDEVIRVNLRGVYISCRAAAPLLISSKGAIVTVASLAAHTVRLEQTAYGASKAAVVQFSKALSLELAQHGVRVNSVCPGSIDTPMIRAAQSQDGPGTLNQRVSGSLDRYRLGIPLRRLGEAEDVASLIAFLLTSAARHITGQAITIDGGESVV